LCLNDIRSYDYQGPYPWDTASSMNDLYANNNIEIRENQYGEKSGEFTATP